MRGKKRFPENLWGKKHNKTINVKRTINHCTTVIQLEESDSEVIL
jgi:hypothetical protein